MQSNTIFEQRNNHETSKHFLCCKTSWRLLQCNNFSSSKTSSRRLQDVFAGHLPKRSSRRLQDVFKTSSQDVFKTSLKRLQDVFKTCLQDVLENKKCSLKTSARSLQDVFNTSSPRRMFAGKCLVIKIFPWSLSPNPSSKNIIQHYA